MRNPLTALLGVLLLSSACADLQVTDLNNPPLDLLTRQPTRTVISAAATGLLIGHRIHVAPANGYVSALGILGRESYNFDTSDPRYVTEMLKASLDPGSPAFGGNFWTQPYANIRNANNLLAAVEISTELSDAEKEATRGFAKTIQALDYLVVINTRDTNGLVIASSGPLDPPDPLLLKNEGRVQGLAHVAQLLDEAKVHLKAGGTTFFFPLSKDFEPLRLAFDHSDPLSPSTFLRFNRAVKARVDVYRQDFSQALTDLGESFVDTAKPLTLGAFQVFGQGSGDTLNGLVSPNLFVHPSVVKGAEHKANGDVDNRVAAKVKAVPERTVLSVTSGYAFTVYPTNTSPVPIIRNEELILLRAEANIGLGNIPAAADDLNFIRTTSGGLPARADLTAGNIVDELLRQRLYSLLFEGGHRWIDARRFGRLGDLHQVDLAEGQKDFTVNDKFPIPVQELDARK